MQILISGAGRTGPRDLAQLRDWLGSAGPTPWQLAPEPEPSGDSLGAGVSEICAIVTATAAIPDLDERVRGWLGTRHAPGPVQLTITIDSARPEDAGELAGTPDERLADDQRLA
jgi:hypothetical protein